jgi:DNA repair protein RecO (recombination protein O)
VKKIKDQGFVIHRRDYSDADRIVTIYTLTHGKISFLAKGVRRPSSRKRGHIELFSLVEFSGTQNTSSLANLNEVQIIKNYENIKKSLPKSSLAYYFCEVTNKITREGQINSDLFQTLKKFLRHIEFHPTNNDIRRRFVNEALIHTGFLDVHESLPEDIDQFLAETIERRLTTPKIARKVLG